MENIFYSRPWVGNFHTHPVASEAALECVIVEPREHANLPAVLRNTSCMLPYAAITIFHSRANETYVRNIIGTENNVKMVCFTESNIDRKQYNNMLTSPDFWDSFEAPKILMFQTDSGIRKNTILRFMEYDYIGAPWHWPIYGDSNIYLGNGGFSLRTPSVMKHICTEVSRNPNYHDQEIGEPEDIYFGRSMVHMNNIILPKYDEASAFSVEHNVHLDPLGFHQAYSFHPKPLVLKWMQDTDPCECTEKERLQIMDAWIEADSGRQWSPPMLRTWLATGIGSAGFRLPKDTKIACVAQDIHPSVRKSLNIVFSNHHSVKVPLYQNRCKEPIHVAP